jgi:hypothetical protein
LDGSAAGRLLDNSDIAIGIPPYVAGWKSYQPRIVLEAVPIRNRFKAIAPVPLWVAEAPWIAK